MQKNILEYLENTAKRLPDKIYLGNEKEEMTFSEVMLSARAIGSFLCDNGYRDEPIVIFMDKHPKTVTAFLGVIYGGCYYVCLDEKMPKQRMEAILENLSPRLVVSDVKNYKAASELSCPHVVLYDEIASYTANDEVLSEIRSAQCDTDPIYVVFTSGSTGVPKGVVACHRSVIDYTETLSAALGFSERSVFANQTPLYFDAPLKELMPAMKFGGTVYFAPRMLFSFPIRLIEFLNEKKINTVCWVVSAFVQISSLGALDKARPLYLEKIAFGSEVFPKQQYNKWREALPDAEFYNLYGPTEATGMSCYWKADRELLEDEPIPIGRPFDNTRILLLDENNTLAKNGEMGEICIGGTCVTLGYYNAHEKTAEVFVRNPLRPQFSETIYRTGDIGRVNEKGELVFVCRKDNQIKHMGHRIELGEIESAALSDKDVSRAVCIYDGEGKRIVLFYTGATELENLSKILGGRLPRYMMPSVIKKLPFMPLTDNGKIDRRTLREMIANGEV